MPGNGARDAISDKTTRGYSKEALLSLDPSMGPEFLAIWTGLETDGRTKKRREKINEICDEDGH